MNEKKVDLAARGVSYGDAYILTGVVMVPIVDDVSDLIQKFPATFTCWFMILNKLMRLLHDPYHVDSWLDIVGYAELALTRMPK